jgi:hypothetical protein
MKRTIVTIATAFLTFSMNAQITIKAEPKSETVWQPSKISNLPNLTMLEVNLDTAYAFYYKNMEYTHITDVNYINLGDKETAVQFFEILKKVSSGDNGNKVVIELNGYTWSIMKASWTVQVYRSGSFFYLNSSQVDSILEKLNQ